MRPQGPTFWLLNGPLGWRGAVSSGVAESEQLGIRLAANPEGPLAFSSADGSLGGLVLPYAMAWDQTGLLYILDANANTIRQFDSVTGTFIALPTLGGGRDARQFDASSNIAIAGHDLYIVDPKNDRVQVVSLTTLALRYVWGPKNPCENDQCCTVSAPWKPFDIAAKGDTAFILDSDNAQVYRHQVGIDPLELALDVPDKKNRWTRIAVDNDHRIYLFDKSAAHLDVYDTQGNALGQVNDSGEVIHRFPFTGIRLDHKGRFCLPEELNALCSQMPQATPAPEKPLAACRGNTEGLLFDRYGNSLAFPTEPEPAGPCLYIAEGTWISEALDSKLFACLWHRIETQLADLPVGTRVVISTYSDADQRTIEDITALPADLWESQPALLNNTQQKAANNGSSKSANDQLADALIQSHEGRYLWLKIELSSDGYATPVIESLRVHYPRDSYLKYLPAIYGSDEQSRRFMERFLSLFQTEWDALEQTIEWMAAIFDPASVPEGDFLAYLAQWLALPLEGAWTEAQKRRLLEAAPTIYEHRGTPAAVRQYLQVYLANMTGLATDEQPFPILIEGFRQRDYLSLSNEIHSTLSLNHPLWSRSVVARLQLDNFATEGKVRLVSTKDPDRDVFHVHAHRFKVFIPSNWVRTKDDEDMVRRALDSEKPAHTQYDLCLVEPRFRVGVQSTVGLDTIMGDYPVAVLAGVSDERAPLSQAPRNHLGYDTVLTSRSSRMGGIALRPDTHLGMNTLLS